MSLLDFSDGNVTETCCTGVECSGCARFEHGVCQKCLGGYTKIGRALVVITYFCADKTNEPKKIYKCVKEIELCKSRWKMIGLYRIQNMLVHSFFWSFRGEGKCLACLDLEAKGLGKALASSPNGGCRKSR